MSTKIKVVDDVIYYNNQAMARIVGSAGVTRDMFESDITGDKLSTLFRQAIMTQASGLAKAKCVTLEELGTILDKVVGK